MTGTPGKRVTFNTPGHWHAVNFSLYKRFRLFDSHELIQLFLQALDAARRKHRFEVWAYCVMPDHVHLMLFPIEEIYSMEEFLFSLKKSSSQRCLNWLRRHQPSVLPKLREVEKSGAVRYRFWQEGPGYDRNLYRGKSTWEQIVYIHGNPVAAGLCESPADWEWSSARWYEGLDGCPFEVARCRVEHPDNYRGVSWMDMA